MYLTALFGQPRFGGTNPVSLSRQDGDHPENPPGSDGDHPVSHSGAAPDSRASQTGSDGEHLVSHSGAATDSRASHPRARDNGPARAEGGALWLMQHPLVAGLMLTLFVCLAIVVVGDGMARRQVASVVGRAQVRAVAALNRSLHESGLQLDAPGVKDRARAVAGTADFGTAARRAMYGVDAMRLDIYSTQGERVFSSTPGPVSVGEAGLAAMAQARAGGSRAVLGEAGAQAGAAAGPERVLTTYAPITDDPAVPDASGNVIMVAALSTDVTGDIADAQLAVWWTAGTFAVGLFAVMWVVFWVAERSRRRLHVANNTLAERNADVLESRRRMLVAADTTRRGIAEELHGSVQTRLYAVWVRLSDLRNRLPESAAASALELEKITAEVDRIREEDIRGLSHRLHPGIVRVSASAGLRSLCSFYSSLVPVELALGTEADELEPAGASAVPENVRLAVYRIAEIALGNVARHARASRARVKFDYDRSVPQLRLSIEDDGQGFDPAAQPAGGLGFTTMHDYADSLGGLLSVESRPGGGTVVRVTLPFTPAPAVSARPAAPATGGGPAVLRGAPGVPEGA